MVNAYRTKTVKELESSAIKRAAKKLHDNPYYSNFLDTLEVDTGVQVRFTDDKKLELLKTLIEWHGFPSIAGNRMGFYFGSIAIDAAKSAYKVVADEIHDASR